MNHLGLWVGRYTEALGLRKDMGSLVPDFQWDAQEDACPLSMPICFTLEAKSTEVMTCFSVGQNIGLQHPYFL